jgi:hypothetical protein
MWVPPEEAEACSGLVVLALRFLAGHGLYLSVGPDRTVSRIIDQLCVLAKVTPQSMALPYDAAISCRSGWFCRVGLLANSVRRAVKTFRDGNIPGQAWALPQTWAANLGSGPGFSPELCARAARLALAASSEDWTAELKLFDCPASAGRLTQEDWDDDSWSDPFGINVDPRSQLLDTMQRFSAGGIDYAIYNDGGGDQAKRKLAACCQARSFGLAGHYWESTVHISSSVSSRLPRRFGHEPSSVHTAELCSFLSGLRWRRLDAWNLLVGDRSALFDVLSRVSTGSHNQLMHYSCAPLEARLARICRELELAWSSSGPKPSWRLSQEHDPEIWNVYRTEPVSGRVKCYSRIAFSRFGLVGLDVKSHQIETSIPYPVIVQGNEQVDLGCEVVLKSPQPLDIHVPSGGYLAFLTFRGRMITRSARDAVRAILREDALQLWKQRPVQGKLGSMQSLVYTGCLDMRFYSNVAIPERWSFLLLPCDQTQVDLTGMLYRCVRAIGGGWTERLKSDPDIAPLARSWAASSGAASFRTCPLCRAGPGTPRHVVMGCSAMRPLVLSWLDAVELELSRHRSREDLVTEGERWRAAECFDGRHAFFPSLPASSCDRWPILAAWHWLLPMASREAIYNADVNESSEAGVRQEYAMDLGYRGIMPLRLGLFLCKASAEGSAAPDPAEHGYEEFATAHQLQQAEDESSFTSQQALKLRPAILVTSLLILGLRKIRAEYSERLDAFCKLLRTQDSAGEDGAAPLPPPAGVQPSLKDRLFAWSATDPGRAVISQLRWQAPSASTLLARLRAESTYARIPEQLALSLVAVWGVPVAHAGALDWGPSRPSWATLRSRLQTPCGCRDAHHAAVVSCCWQCGGVRLPRLSMDPLACKWCQSRSGTVCPGCNRVLHYIGVCSTWNAGAATAFKPDRDHLQWLCPDCYWMWVRSLSASPRHPPAEAANGTLLAHLQSLVGRPQHGAGASVALPTCTISVRKARRWILRTCNASCYALTEAAGLNISGLAWGTGLAGPFLRPVFGFWAL